ncbi:transglutaminase-like domain-containing protein [Streptomyces sp. B3I8]|uniref:transglutaminase-like domain-containing protein n=1 Tax=Streptomyces sp. B3I8 TaxID=3042303 RepID=UPI0027858A8A|nr:transglutaminase-like domain-containing protein [Streptomyces sp. B3I8]MDQ0789002.1 regulator of sirC expression with transglutaminase-like and TPR domain [Streptomyces sp. B3I8]
MAGVWPPARPVPPGRERGEEVRRRFAEEARAKRPDLATLCLLVGAAADGTLDDAGTDAVDVRLDELAGQLPFRPGGPRSWARALAELLGGRLGFAGTPADYQRLESSLLHEVLRRRRGLPILLSVLWMEVARRAGAPVYGVALPGHFVVGFGSVEELGAGGGFGSGGEQVLADPFAGGRVLTGDDAELLVAGTTGAALDPAMLTPADPLEIVLRVLNNVRAWAAARPERSDVALWALELSLRLPAHPARLRYEYARTLVLRGEFLAGAEQLEAYAEVVGALDEAAADTVRAEARGARARLN